MLLVGVAVKKKTIWSRLAGLLVSFRSVAACRVVRIRSISARRFVPIRSISSRFADFLFGFRADTRADTKDKAQTQKKPDSSIGESGSAIARRRALLTFG